MQQTLDAASDSGWTNAGGPGGGGPDGGGPDVGGPDVGGEDATALGAAAVDRRYRIVARIALVWAILGCADAALTVMRVTPYLINLPRNVVDWLDSTPEWTFVPWALGPGAALFGSLCLLARSRYAVTWFAWSLGALAVLQVWEIAFGLPPSLRTVPALAVSAMVWVVTVALLAFAVVQRRAGVLR